MVRVGIIGATGYVGGELVRLIHRHSQAEVACLAAIVDTPDLPVDAYFPDLWGMTQEHVRAVESAEATIALMKERTDAIFLALPHTASQIYAAPLLEAGKTVLDLGADFRFRSVEAYEDAYGVKHQYPDLTRGAVYGLPELYRAQLKGRKLTGVAGCYPTSVLLPLAPFMRDLSGIRPDLIIADSKSGVSGAGRGLSETAHFVNANESMMAYKVASHRHCPEMEENLSALAGKPIQLTFTPHLAPMDRGIHSTIYLGVEDGFTEAEARRRLEAAYGSEPFVRVMAPGAYPSTKGVSRTHYCHIGVKLDARNKRLVLCSVIDNLIRGAAGTAVQCMNAMMGFDEADGLK